ncbi:MAG: type II toxin-antitoxin system prevent-host-death family antitoxin [Actinomycetota bacterium]|nr:type II toxin-antitoxin system prevent-host-death family antitoxin [Actinomycetota bacterium]
MQVTERGKLVALLMPPGPGQHARERLISSGRLIPTSSPTGRLHASSPVQVANDEASNEDLLDAEREERA